MPKPSRAYTLVLLGCVLTAMVWGAPAWAGSKQTLSPRVVGWVEDVYVQAIGTEFQAKLDTGAKTSSIDAEIIDIVEYTPPDSADAATKDVKTNVVGKIIFSVVDAHGKAKTLERDIIRFARIKRKGNAGFIRRPVVRMRFCLAGREIDDEVNLAVRDRFVYPILIGRNMLEKGGLVVDASRMLTSPSTCPTASGDN